MSGVPPATGEAVDLLDVIAVRRWAVMVRHALAERRDEIDALNVFPVPDGDTGTNLYLTFDGALDRTFADNPEAPLPQEVGPLLKAFAANLLWTARGNSGVILSQIVRGLAEGVGEAAVIDGPLLALGLARADERAWQGVTDPKEGTILSVSRAAAAGAAAAAEAWAAGSQVNGAGCLGAVAKASAEAAHTALERTPEQLEVLAQAGVVDAGGAGLLVLLECLDRLVSGDESRVLLGRGADGRRRRFRPVATAGVRSGGAGARAAGGVPARSESTRGPEYEVMYLLETSVDGAEVSVDRLRQRLVELGDSVLVVGGDGLWNVHAHVDDPGSAVEAGIETGRPHRVRITRLLADDGTALIGHGEGLPVELFQAGGPGVDGLHAEPVAGRQVASGEAARGRVRQWSDEPLRGSAVTGMVACAAGEGIAQLFGDEGAVVITSGPARRASTGQFIEAIRQVHATGVRGIVILPNDADTELAAAAAARAATDVGIHAVVVRARTAVQGIAALAVYEPAASPQANVLAMQSAASATRHGAVTVANRVGLTSGGPCKPGDVLGVVDGDIVLVGSDQLTIAREVVHRLLASGGELVTVLVGADAPDEIVEAIAAEAREAHRGVELNPLDGGQPVYSVLIGVE